MAFIKPSGELLNHLILLLIGHVTARGQAEAIDEEALVDASAVMGAPAYSGCMCIGFHSRRES